MRVAESCWSTVYDTIYTALGLNVSFYSSDPGAEPSLASIKAMSTRNKTDTLHTLALIHTR
jgi:hypothetical protein